MTGVASRWSGACIVPYGPCPCKWNPEYYLGAALHQVQRLNQTYRHFTRIEYASETLSRIPSIIYGLVGMLLFSNNFGTRLLTGMLTLVVMNLPTVTRTTQESLKTVPQSYHEGAFGLGAGKWRMICTVVFPDTRMVLSPVVSSLSVVSSVGPSGCGDLG